MKMLTKIVCLFAFALMLTSCSMSKGIPYFKELESTNDFVGATQHEARICSDDMLSITVNAANSAPEVVAPFNLPVVAYLSPGSNQISQNATLQPYLVDIDGYITFPILGKLKVGGLKKSEAVELIAEKLKPYLAEPIVNIQFMNYKITVLGEVLRPGSYTINSERVSLLDALGLAGDMTIYGRRDNVLLMRENEGGRKEYIRVNLNETDILSSPYYYLQQNDVVYVEPNKTKVQAASSANASLYLSGLSTICSMVTVIVAVIGNVKNNQSGGGN